MSQAKLFPEDSPKKKFLNVGGGPRNTAPEKYKDWECVWLDIDPEIEPDVVCDARELHTLPAKEYDAVYCSHNLEHYFRHDALEVLKGFLHVLKDDGFAHIIVPDIQAVMVKVVNSGLDIGDVLYISPAGPITVRDVIYGYEKEISITKKDYYAHKTGFSTPSLKSFMHEAGFEFVGTASKGPTYEAIAVGFKQEPTDEQRKFLSKI